MKVLRAQNMLLHITYFINTNPDLFKGLKREICLSMENLHFNIKVCSLFTRDPRSDYATYLAFRKPEDSRRRTAGRKVAACTDSAE